jgi:general secretion pathway protein J
MKSRRGFTLIELMVAVAIFAVMAVMAYRGLRAVAQTQSAIVQSENANRALDRLFATLERDCLQAVPRAVRGAYNQREAAFVGDATTFKLTTQQLSSDGVGGFVEGVRVGYQLSGDKLYRSSQRALDSAPNTPETRRLVLEDVSQFRLRYVDLDRRPLDRFPDLSAQPADERAAASAADILPRALEVSFQVEGLGQVRRIFLISEAKPFVEGAP